MKAYIKVLQIPSNKEVQIKPYTSEEEALTEFNSFTSDEVKYGISLQIDLVVEHPTEGKLIRKTTFIKKAESYLEVL